MMEGPFTSSRTCRPCSFPPSLTCSALWRGMFRSLLSRNEDGLVGLSSACQVKTVERPLHFISFPFMPVGFLHSSVCVPLSDSVMASSSARVSSTAAISSATQGSTYSANHTLAATRRQTSLDIKEQRERSMDLAATSYTGDTETREKPKIPKPHDVRSPRATEAPVTGVSGRIADLYVLLSRLT